MIKLSEAQLEAMLTSLTKPVAAAFVRERAAPADALLRALKSAEAKLGGRVELVEIDIDACPHLVDTFRIHRVPELLVWSPQAKLIARMEGAMSDEQALDFLEHALTRL